MAIDLELEPWEELRRLETTILTLVPSNNPPVCHWLETDGGTSYCHECARLARAKEMGIFSPPEQPAWKLQYEDYQEYERLSDLVEAFEEGIGGGWDTHSDHMEYCDTCGKQLSCILTEYGVDEFLDCYFEHPYSNINDESAYTLERVFLNLTGPVGETESDGEERMRLFRALLVARHALSLIEVQNADK